VSKERIALALATWAGVWAGTAAVAQPLDRPGTAFTGTVASADAFRLVLRADNGVLVSFAIEDPTTVPAGLVSGMRVTVRYEKADGQGYRLVGVKIASEPIEPGSTTDPPVGEPSTSTLSEQPATPPAPAPPEAERPRLEAAATPPVVAATAARSAESAGPRLAASPETSRPLQTPRPAPLPPAPGLREIATLAALLVVAGMLLWVSFVQG
jgi:hypothetical protein